MRIARIGMGLVLALFCLGLQAETRTQKITVTGKLTRVMAIGGESTGWSIQLEPEINIEGKQVNSIEIGYHDAGKLERLANKHVKARGRLSHRHGVETGDRTVLEVSSINETPAR
jgi:hypothetical protein